MSQSTPFGPFINRHHFAGYMELAMALPLGLLLSGSIEKEKRVIYLFAAALNGSSSDHDELSWRNDQYERRNLVRRNRWACGSSEA